MFFIAELFCWINVLEFIYLDHENGNLRCSNYFDGFFLKILFIFREEKGGRKRGRETLMCGCHLSAPYWWPGLQPRHVPWLGIEPVTLWFAGRHSIHWATPARADGISNVVMTIPATKSWHAHMVTFLWYTPWSAVVEWKNAQTSEGFWRAARLFRCSPAGFAICHPTLPHSRNFLPARRTILSRS